MQRDESTAWMVHVHQACALQPCMLHVPARNHHLHHQCADPILRNEGGARPPCDADRWSQFQQSLQRLHHVHERQPSPALHHSSQQVAAHPCRHTSATNHAMQFDSDTPLPVTIRQPFPQPRRRVGMRHRRRVQLTLMRGTSRAFGTAHLCADRNPRA